MPACAVFESLNLPLPQQGVEAKFTARRRQAAPPAGSAALEWTNECERKLRRSSSHHIIRARITSLDATIRTEDEGSLLLILSLRAGHPSLSLLAKIRVAGAMILAQTIPPEYTPRSKHYAIKTNWFREQIVKRGIELMKGSYAHA
eukprot:scaffold19288_cov79-Skeletonema_dohrnii-CCMP3373.AAC.1